MPDAELYQLAAWGKLREGDNLSAQVRRMLADGKAYDLSATISDHFAVFSPGDGRPMVIGSPQSD